MARPQKKGLDYFSLDCHMNDEVGLIVGDYGMEGFGVLIQLFQVIYGNEGYFMNWGKKEQKLFSHRVRIDLETVINIVNDCLEWDIFSSAKFNDFQVLTSHRIQEHYQNATYRRKDVKIIENYSLLELMQENVDNNRVNVDINPPSGVVSDNKSTQSILHNIIEYYITLHNIKKYIKDLVVSAETKPTPAKIVKLYNDICISLPRCQKLTTVRTTKINARIKELSTMNEWKDLFKLTQDTPFCKGNNNRDWRADIDWLIKNDDNYIKILEGKYDYCGKIEPKQEDIKYSKPQRQVTPEEQAENDRILQETLKKLKQGK